MKAKNGVAVGFLARYSNQFYLHKSFGLNHFKDLVGDCVGWG